MKVAMEETDRRRRIQAEYNQAHGITPESIKKEIPALEYAVAEMDYVQLDLAAESTERYGKDEPSDQLIQRLEKEMKAAAKELAFERAADSESNQGVEAEGSGVAALDVLIEIDANEHAEDAQ